MVFVVARLVIGIAGWPPSVMSISDERVFTHSQKKAIVIFVTKKIDIERIEAIDL